MPERTEWPKQGAKKDNYHVCDEKLLTGCILAAACMTVGCESMSNTAGGALGGGLLGGTAGALLGGPRGALVGAGRRPRGGVGNSVDQQEKRDCAGSACGGPSGGARPC